MPPEVEQAIDKRASMTAIGNLNDYVKYQMAQGMASGGGGGAAGTAAETRRRLRPGAADDAAGLCRRPGHADGRARAPALPELLGVADAAQALGVSEADVVAVLESGELKGKKIGSTWRISRAALTAYMNA